MAKKLIKYRNSPKTDGTKTRNYSQSTQDYFKQYDRTHYRTVGIKFNIDKEEEILAWLDHQEGLKKYITDLIKEDMLKKQNANELSIAKLESYNSRKELAERNELEENLVPVVCENCKRRELIKSETYDDLKSIKSTCVCPSCNSKMFAYNYNPNLYTELGSK